MGDIEDEYDFDETEDNILVDRSGRYRVKAVTEIADFNKHFGTTFSDEDYDTVGGFVMARLGRIPRVGDRVDVPGYEFRVVAMDGRRVDRVVVIKKESERASAVEGPAA